MQKIKINNWKWVIEDSALLHGWFERWEDYARDSAVKKNPVRTVFRIDDLFFVKVEQPFEFRRQIRSFLLPKAGREFLVARALEAEGVPVVKHLGWAKCGSSNMLLTEAVPDARSVLEYWYSEIVYGNKAKKKFLDGFCAFLKQFLDSGFYHPDFHIGNILYSPAKEEFLLVDVYGLSRPEKLSVRQLDEHSRIILELAGRLSDQEACELLLKIRDDFSLEEAQDFWRKGLEKKALAANKNWPKRRAQIQDNYSKFIEIVDKDDIEFLLRKQPGPVPAVALNRIPGCLNGNNFDIMRLPHDEAEDLWLESFRLELLGIDHPRPLVFEKPGVLYFEKVPAGSPKASGDRADEYIVRAGNAGIKIAPESLLQFPNERIVSTKVLFA
jgi:hypothetical protein